MGMPQDVLDCIITLYRRSRCMIRIGSRSYHWFSCADGFKEGCLLAPIAFILMIDPWMRRAAVSLGLQSGLWSVADDICTVCHDLCRGLPTLRALFRWLFDIPSNT